MRWLGAGHGSETCHRERLCKGTDKRDAELDDDVAERDELVLANRMDAFAAMEARRATGSAESNAVMGRGATAGWVRCPLCSARRQKRFARGRGLQMLSLIHI